MGLTTEEPVRWTRVSAPPFKKERCPETVQRGQVFFFCLFFVKLEQPSLNRGGELRHNLSHI